MKERESQCGKASGVREDAERGSDETTQGELPHKPWEREQGAGSWRIPSNLARDNRAKASEEQGQRACVCGNAVGQRAARGMWWEVQGPGKGLPGLELWLHHSFGALGKPFSLPEFQPHHPHCDQSAWLGRPW